MDLYFSGAENAGWRELLSDQGVEHMEVSYVGMSRRRRTTPPLAPYEGKRVLLNAGTWTFNRPGSQASDGELRDIAASYVEYLRDNAALTEMFTDFDSLDLGAEWVREHRETVLERIAPDKIMPIWHPHYGMAELRRLASAYSHLGITQAAIGDTDLISLLNQLVLEQGVHLHGVGITKVALMRQISFASVSSSSWLSPAHFGDTIWWTGRELKRYPRSYREQGRRRHRNGFTDAGFDATKIENDDTIEVLKAGIWSFRQFVASIQGVTQPTNPLTRPIMETGGGVVDQSPDAMRNSAEPPRARPRPRTTTPIPTLGTDESEQTYLDETGSPAVRRLRLLRASGDSLRACDTCFVARKCPGHEAGSACLYEIPVEIRTRDQLCAVQDMLIEMQTQRVAFLKMAEDLEGGYADSNLSAELDRLTRMIAARQRLDEQGFSLKLTARDSNGPGIMSRFFGDTAAQRLQAIESPVRSDELLAELGGNHAALPGQVVRDQAA